MPDEPVEALPLQTGNGRLAAVFGSQRFPTPF